jgi:hypothetical protein
VRRVVEQAIGEELNGSPLPDKDAVKNPAAVALGKLGGAKWEGARVPNSRFASHRPWNLRQLARLERRKDR